MAQVRPLTMAASTSTKTRHPGQPRWSRAASIMEASAKGRANTVWLNFTNEAHLESREIIGAYCRRRSLEMARWARFGGPDRVHESWSRGRREVNPFDQWAQNYSTSSCQRTLKRWAIPMWSSTRATTVSATASTVVGRL